MQMISLYLEQTPPLINAMLTGLMKKDWETLYSAVHKLIPSLSIMGISADFENMAKKIQEYASNQQIADGIPEMVHQLEKVCKQSCVELTEQYETMQKQ